MSRPSWLALAAAATILSHAPFAHGGSNPRFNLPLHAVLAQAAPCEGYLPVDCRNIYPTVNAPPHAELVVFLLIHNFAEVTGVQTAFSWDPTWTLVDTSWNCQPNQITAVVPEPPGGETAGTIATAFDCVTGGLSVAVIGRMRFLAGDAGCLRQVYSSYPFGDHVVDCQYGRDQANPYLPLDALRFGSICVNQGGHSSCFPAVPTEPATWGRIKATYQ